MTLHYAKIKFKADEEKEEYKSNVGCEVEKSDRLRGENMFSESGYVTENRWPQQHSSNDLGNDSRLTYLSKDKS